MGQYPLSTTGCRFRSFLGLDAWLDRDLRDPEVVAGLLQPIDPEIIMEHPVTSRVNSVRTTGGTAGEGRAKHILLMQQVLRREMGLVGAIVTGLGSIPVQEPLSPSGSRPGSGRRGAGGDPDCRSGGRLQRPASAFLAARFPVAGGTYEYGYRTLGPSWGFTAGWLFLLRRPRSAAAAALGVSEFLDTPWDPRITAAAAVVVLTGLVLAGLRRTIVVNVVLVAVTVVAIVGFGVAGLTQPGPQTAIDGEAIRLGVLPAITFLFVAYTGYGRIATLGEEVRRPAVTIPRAVMVSLVVAVCLYGLVAIATSDR